MKNHLLYFLLLIGIYTCAQPPRYNQVFQAATHNSYWVKRAAGVDFFAGGASERLLDQLLFDHTRTLEIDIHKMRGVQGQWTVYHAAQKKNTFCADLPEFLKQLLQFHYALPQHEVVTVILELKEVSDYNFDETHTPADLDKIIEGYLGGLLFKPADLMKHCPHDSTLCDCAASSPDVWPTIQELRGKFIFVALGNWHWRFLGHGGLGWATYSNSANPVAFPMSSGFSEFNSKRHKTEMIDPAMLARAYKASIFKQVEELGDTTVPGFVKRGGIVRSGAALSTGEQGAFLKEGFQMFMTDFAWLQVGDKGYSQAFRPIDPVRFADTSLFVEPGNRIFINGTTEKFWSLGTNNQGFDWETLPSSTRPSPNSKYPNPHNGYGKGCLVAKSEDGQSSISVCRKVNTRQNSIISVQMVQSGATTTKSFTAGDRNCGQVGDMIRLKLEPDSANGLTARVYSSSEARLSNSGSTLPLWNEIFIAHFGQNMLKQGLVASEGDVLFVGTKLNGQVVTETQLLKGP